jgi:uncharacterized phage infection (PIP) family protein YhgE
MKNNDKAQKKSAEAAIKAHIQTSITAELNKISEEYGGKVKKLERKANKIAKWLSKKIKIDKVPEMVNDMVPVG